MDSRVSLKALKVIESQSEETICYSATVYLDGKPVLYASNDGRGGADLFLRHERATAPEHHELLRLARAWVESRPAPPWWNESESYNHFVAGTHDETLLEWMMAELIAAKREEQTLRRWCRSSIVLRAPGAEPGHYQRLRVRYDPNDVRQTRAIAERYPDHEVVNLRF